MTAPTSVAVLMRMGVFLGVTDRTQSYRVTDRVRAGTSPLGDFPGSRDRGSSRPSPSAEGSAGHRVRSSPEVGLSWAPGERYSRAPGPTGRAPPTDVIPRGVARSSARGPLVRGNARTGGGHRLPVGSTPHRGPPAIPHRSYFFATSTNAIRRWWRAPLRNDDSPGVEVALRLRLQHLEEIDAVLRGGEVDPGLARDGVRQQAEAHLDLGRDARAQDREARGRGTPLGPRRPPARLAALVGHARRLPRPPQAGCPTEDSWCAQRRGDELAEERVRVRRAALELGVELHADEPRVVAELDDLDEVALGVASRRSRRPAASSALAVVVVELVAVAVALVDRLVAVGRARAACPARSAQR